MQKVDMREWVSALEGMIDNKLSKWKKIAVIEDSSTVHLGWQFQQTMMLLSIAWPDQEECVTLHCISPGTCHRYTWLGLTDKTFNRTADRVGNLAQITMHPPIEPNY